MAGMTVNPVLYFRQSLCRADSIRLDGVLRYASRACWDVQTIELSSMVVRSNRRRSVPSPDISALLDFWKPLGCIVNVGVAPILLRARDFGKTPTVFLDRCPDTLEKGAVCVPCDSIGIAQDAARELLESGFDDYAYVPEFGDPAWSEERGREFRRLVTSIGRGFHLFQGRSANTESRLRELAKWVVSLPRPCGVFAANDAMAKLVAAACASVRIEIPDELVLIGVDDFEPICENVRPTLSSVRQNHFCGGWLAAETLELLLRGMPLPGRARFGSGGVVRRASTRRPGCDRRVARALEFIRRHASERIGVADVIAAMACSRSLANLRFRAATGHTILDEIRAVRLSKVEELLLQPQMTLASLAGFCGFSSAADLRRVFKKQTGKTLRERRRELIG